MKYADLQFRARARKTCISICLVCKLHNSAWIGRATRIIRARVSDGNMRVCGTTLRCRLHNFFASLVCRKVAAYHSLEIKRKRNIAVFRAFQSARSWRRINFSKNLSIFLEAESFSLSLSLMLLWLNKIKNERFSNIISPPASFLIK